MRRHSNPQLTPEEENQELYENLIVIKTKYSIAVKSIITLTIFLILFLGGLAFCGYRYINVYMNIENTVRTKDNKITSLEQKLKKAEEYLEERNAEIDFLQTELEKEREAVKERKEALEKILNPPSEPEKEETE